MTGFDQVCDDLIFGRLTTYPLKFLFIKENDLLKWKILAIKLIRVLQAMPVVERQVRGRHGKQILMHFEFNTTKYTLVITGGFDFR